MKQTSFIFDSETDGLLERLKVSFGVRTKAQVVRKALALANAAVEFSNTDENTVTFKTEDNGERVILLKG